MDTFYLSGLRGGIVLVPFLTLEVVGTNDDEVLSQERQRRAMKRKQEEIKRVIKCFQDSGAIQRRKKRLVSQNRSRENMMKVVEDLAITLLGDNEMARMVAQNCEKG